MVNRNRQDIVGDFERYFGNQNNVVNWQRLCDDVRIEGAWSLWSIKACREALSHVNVNIHELVEATAANRQVRLFGSRAELINWTRKHKKYYPLRMAKEGGPVKGLLVKMRGYNK